MENVNSSTQETSTAKQDSPLKSFFVAAIIPLSLVAAVLIYNFIFGNPSNFEGGDPENNPLPGNYLGVIYKGGIIVPILLTLLILVLTFTLERFFTINKASGKGNTDSFVQKIKNLLASNELDNAVAECDRQQGAVANVVKSVLRKYNQVSTEKDLTRDQKALSIQKEVEEATALELPMLEKNLVILATITSLSTLIGLLGTVIGMIRAFSALAHAGAPDSVALATGISEALINTALGIGTSSIAIIAYNYFTTKIDRLMYCIDEAGFSITQTFVSSHGK